jgi:Zn-dependent protease with chaperone function
MVLAKYSREFELEADQYSADIMLQLGLDPKKIVELFDLIEAKCEGACDGGSFFASHPSFADRRSNLSQH